MHLLSSENTLIHENNSEYLDLFRELSLKYQACGAEAGVYLTPFSDASLPLFSKQPILNQKKIIDALKTSVKICLDTKAEIKSLNNPVSLVWQALKELGLRPPADLFSHMTDCTVIEIYSPENVQIFRSFSFFEFCSYSLEELYCCPWLELFPRDNQNIIPMVLEFTSKVFSGEIQKTVSLKHIPVHTVREAFSTRKYVLEVSVNWGAPLFKQGASQPAAAIFLESGRLVGKDTAQPISPAKPLFLVSS
jgi:hypothetical protein